MFLTEFPNADARWLVADGGTRPRFSRDGRELFYVKGSVDERGQSKEFFMSATVTVNPTVTMGPAVQLFEDGGPAGPRIDGYDVALDGRRFVMSKPVAPAPGEGSRLVLVQNWLAGMKK